MMLVMGEVEIVRVGKRGAVIVPAEIRDKIGMRAGDKMLVVARKGRIVLRKVSEGDFERGGKWWRFWDRG